MTANWGQRRAQRQGHSWEALCRTARAEVWAGGRRGGRGQGPEALAASRMGRGESKGSQTAVAPQKGWALAAETCTREMKLCSVPQSEGTAGRNGPAMKAAVRGPVGTPSLGPVMASPLALRCPALCRPQPGQPHKANSKQGPVCSWHHGLKL